MNLCTYLENIFKWQWLDLHVGKEAELHWPEKKQRDVDYSWSRSSESLEQTPVWGEVFAAWRLAMFCVYTTLLALNLFCSAESAPGHCLFLTCLYPTQGAMTSRIVGGCRHDPAHYLPFSFTFQVHSQHGDDSHRPVSVVMFNTIQSNVNTHPHEEIGYYAKLILSFWGIGDFVSRS